MKRREMVIYFVGSIATVMVEDPARAEMVDPTSPSAASLGFVSSYQSVNTSRYPKYKDGQRCGKCALFSISTYDDTIGKCPLYPRFTVSVDSWCSAFAFRAGPTPIAPANQNVNPQTTVQDNKPIVTQNNTMSIKDAKSKCEDLGFLPDSEAFGKCVLKLTQ